MHCFSIRTLPVHSCARRITPDQDYYRVVQPATKADVICMDYSSYLLTSCLIQLHPGHSLVSLEATHQPATRLHIKHPERVVVTRHSRQAGAGVE
jgi:hypothetical protein